MNAVLTTPPKIFPCNLQERLNIHSFVEKCFFLKVFFCTCKMQFWQTRRNYVYKKRKVSGPISERTNRTTFFSKKTIFPPNIPMDRKKVFFETSWKNFPFKGQNFFVQHTKALKKHIIQKIDLHKDPIVSVKAVLTTMPIPSLQSPRRI